MKKQLLFKYYYLYLIEHKVDKIPLSESYDKEKRDH